MSALPRVTITITRRGSTKPVNKRQLAADKRKLEQALGALVLSWAHLHERLEEIFEAVTKCKIWLARAMWHSLKSDLSQRELLRSAVTSSKLHLEAMRKDLPERFDSVISNCTGLEVFCCTTIARAATR